MGPPIIRLVVAYGAGLWAGLVFLVPPGAGMMGALGLAAVFGARRGGLGLLGAALGLALSAVVHLRERGDCARHWSPGPHRAVLRVHDRPGHRGTTSATVLYAPEGCGGAIPVRLDTVVPGGSRVIAVGRTAVPVVFRVSRVRTLEGARPPRFVLRDAAARRIATLYGARAPLVEALVTGRRDDLDPALRRRFAGSGLAHVLAISGLHVGIMAGWCALLLRLIMARTPAALSSAGLAWLYVALLGFPAPASRAAAFLTVIAVARHLQRHPAAGAALAVTVLAVLTVDPRAATSVGAWLSVAAVWGTGEAGRAVPPAWRAHPVAGLLAASMGATVATAPISAFVFGSVAPIGVAANLAAVPLSALAVPAVFASLAVGGIAASGAGLALAGIERTATLAAAVPGGHLEGEPGAGFALPWILLLGAVVWARHRRPTWLVARRRLLVAAALASWGAAVLPSLPPSRGAGRLMIYILDVGQGDAIAIRSPEGLWALVDAGPRTPYRDAGRAVVLPFLERQRVPALAVMIASHGDADHLGGVPAVVRALGPDLVLEPGQPLPTALYLEHLAAADAVGADWRAARAGDTLHLGSVSLAVLHPTPEWLAATLEPNENSVVLHLLYREFDALLTGDIGAAVEAQLTPRLGRIELLKVGHHGSAGGTTAAWLARLRPAAAVISVGDNRYGHPAPAVLARLAAAGVPVWRTDRGGTVTIESDGRYFWVEQLAPRSLEERLRCLARNWLPSIASFSGRKSCTVAPRVSFPTFSTK